MPGILFLPVTSLSLSSPALSTITLMPSPPVGLSLGDGREVWDSPFFYSLESWWASAGISVTHRDSLVSKTTETQWRKRHTIRNVWLWCSWPTSYTDISSGGWFPNTTPSTGFSKLFVVKAWKEQKAKDIPILPQGCFQDKGKEMGNRQMPKESENIARSTHLV